MKKRMLFALMSGVVLIGALGLLGCSSSEEVVTNPDYDPETGSVKTQFVFNVTQSQERTRQTNIVVGNSWFQGINDMYLFCFDGTPSASGTYSTFDENHMFSLDAFGKPEPELSGDDTNNSSKVYTLYIPTRTEDFLFYATANNSAKDAQPENYGKLIKTYSDAISSVDEITFNLANQVSDAAAITEPQTALAGILNGIVSIEITTPEELKWSAAVDHGHVIVLIYGECCSIYSPRTVFREVNRKLSCLCIVIKGFHIDPAVFIHIVVRRSFIFHKGIFALDV